MEKVTVPFLLHKSPPGTLFLLLYSDKPIGCAGHDRLNRSASPPVHGQSLNPQLTHPLLGQLERKQTVLIKQPGKSQPTHRVTDLLI
jgi:hypothetical protein